MILIVVMFVLVLQVAYAIEFNDVTLTSGDNSVFVNGSSNMSHAELNDSDILLFDVSTDSHYSNPKNASVFLWFKEIGNTINKIFLEDTDSLLYENITNQNVSIDTDQMINITFLNTSTPQNESNETEPSGGGGSVDLPTLGDPVDNRTEYPFNFDTASLLTVIKQKTLDFLDENLVINWFIKMWHIFLVYMTICILIFRKKILEYAEQKKYLKTGSSVVLTVLIIPSILTISTYILVRFIMTGGII